MFISKDEVFKLVIKYGTPLYVYDEKTLRKSCKEMYNLLPGKNLRISYSAKANSNIELLKIIRDEDIDADAMSPGEIYLQELAGFSAERIFFIPNNVSAEELLFAIERKIPVSVDSISQLDLFGKINPGGEVSVRLNPGTGLGHHEKVITAGKKTKFGIQMSQLDEVKLLLKKHNLKLSGLNQHLGSHVLTKEPFLAGVKVLLEIAKQFPDLSVIDFGGGFGVPYREGENRLDLADLSISLDQMITEFLNEYGNKDVLFRIEPGRYIAAECGILLGTVQAVKTNYDTEYIGTDLGCNVLMRPVLYDSYHEVDIIKKDKAAGPDNGEKKKYTVVGNICENGDVLAKERDLPEVNEGDIVVVNTAGAYGFSMSSNYNCRLKPAEVLIDLNGNHRLIRRRETLEDLIKTSILEK